MCHNLAMCSCYEPFRDTRSRQTLKSPDLRFFKVQTVIQMKITLFHHSSPIIDRIGLSNWLIGLKKADGMEVANVAVKTIVTFPFPTSFPLTFSALGKKVLTLRFMACMSILFSPHASFGGFQVPIQTPWSFSVLQLGKTDG